MKNIYFILLLTILFIGACKSDNETDDNTDDEVEIRLDSDFYNGYYQTNISTAINSFKEEITTEITYIQNFKTSKNDDDFELMKLQWLNSAKAYAKVKVYDFGLIENNFYDKNIHNFPVSSDFIDVYISEKNIYNTEYLNTKSTVTKGLGAMEFLIYANNDSELAKNLLIEDNYRIDYLLATAQEVLRQTNLIINTWENGYKETFINYNEETCSKNATCLSFNELINIVDVTKVTKIGKTAGFESSTNIAPYNLEAFRSRSSLILIQSMLEEVKYAYQGSTYNFASLVNQLDSEQLISSAIDEQFTKIESTIATLDNNLYDAINTDNTSVKPIYDALGELTILLSVDVASLLNLTILPTDNDGD